jgi:hypothetical protein
VDALVLAGGPGQFADLKNAAILRPKDGSNDWDTVYVDLQGLVKTPDPKIVGTARVNNTLTAVVGTWDSGVVLTYQWIRDGARISKATGKSYRLSAADRKAEIVLRVKAVKVGFESVTIDSRQVIVR